MPCVLGGYEAKPLLPQDYVLVLGANARRRIADAKAYENEDN